MHEVFYPDDDMTIDECHHVWIDHCEFYSKIGPGIGVDTYDGLLDIKKGSHNVTVSWCHFHDHMKTILIGHSDNNGAQDANLEVTFHHNWFSNTDGRNPSLRFGKVHYFNNYLENIADYGFAVRNGAHAKIENCHYESVNIPIATDKFEGHGFACISNCIYSGSCSENDNRISEPVDCDFWNDEIPYSYTLESTNTVKISVETYAGVGKIRTVTSSPLVNNRNNLQLNSIFYERNNERINLSVSVKTSEKLMVSIVSPEGKTLFIHSEKVNPGVQKIILPVSFPGTGIYIVKIESLTERITQKIIL
jgi:pectate lyase